MVLYWIRKQRYTIPLLMGKSFIPRHKKEQQVELLLLYVFERITVFEKYISISEDVLLY